MSSDWKDSGATWQSPQHDPQAAYTHQQAHDDDDDVTQDAPEQDQYDVDAHAYRAHDDQRYQAGYQGHQDYQNAPAADFEEPPPTPITQRGDLLHTVIHYATLVGAPILFGGLTALWVLPLVANGRAATPAAAFWPLAVLIILIVIAQGTTVYYLGSINDLWFVFTLLGFLLFLLVGCFSTFGAIPGFLLLALIVVLGVFLVRRYLHAVPEGYVALAFAFGKYRRTLLPGPHLLLPWERIAYELNTGEIQWICPTQRVQLAPDTDVILRASISYQVLPDYAYLAMSRVNGWEETLRELFLAALQTIATTFSPGDFLAWPDGPQGQPVINPSLDDFSNGARWEQVNNYLFQYMRNRVAAWGVQVNGIQIRDVSLSSHGAHLVDSPPLDHAAYAYEQPTPASYAQQQVPQFENTYTQQELASPPAGNRPPVFKEEVLVNAYKQVQEGKITDPETIRNLARTFEAIAHDPEANGSVSFDPMRAAENLYAEADHNEQLASASPASNSAHSSRVSFEDDTNPDWYNPRHPT
ncbi:SPFH domain-containing protein [Ktedonobacter robiniae]|uniref:SPFH domain-containing protein n=1 Tax=Ktedonobacter robiniae TaxID=2778365 RepID=UPI00191642D8|nr:SPFH domain-containing protein [Ktedonobacter robiniae]